MKFVVKAFKKPNLVTLTIFLKVVMETSFTDNYFCTADSFQHHGTWGPIWSSATFIEHLFMAERKRVKKWPILQFRKAPLTILSS